MSQSPFQIVIFRSVIQRQKEETVCKEEIQNSCEFICNVGKTPYQNDFQAIINKSESLK